MADVDLIKRNIGKMIDAGASESDIDAYIKSEGADVSSLKMPPTGLEVAKDVGRGFRTGAIEGAANVAGLPGDLVELGARGHNAAVQGAAALTGIPAAPRQPEAPAFGSQRVMQEIEGAVGGPLYQPQTPAGEAARTTGQFLPGLAIGGGGVAGAGRRALTHVLMPALSSEAGGQGARASSQPELEPYGRLGGAFLGGAAAGTMSGMLPKYAAPTRAALKTSARAGYQSPEVMALEIKPDEAHRMVTGIKARLENELDNEVIRGTLNALSKEQAAWAPSPVNPMQAVTKVAPPVKPPVSITEIDDLRSRLGNMLKSEKPQERLAAARARNEINDFLDNLQQNQLVGGNASAAVPILRQARADYGAQYRAGIADNKALAAELRSDAANSGFNLGNATRQRMVDVVLNPKLHAGWTPEEMAQLRKIVSGTAFGNTMRDVGNTLGGGGGVAGPVVALGAAATTGRPELLALPLAGRVARALSNRSVLRQTEKLNEMLRNRSALGPQQVPYAASDTMSPAVAAALLEANSSPFRIPARNQIEQ